MGNSHQTQIKQLKKCSGFTHCSFKYSFIFPIGIIVKVISHELTTSYEANHITKFDLTQKGFEKLENKSKVKQCT